MYSREYELVPYSGDQAAAPSYRGWILAARMLAMTLAAMDITIVATAVPQIVGDLYSLRVQTPCECLVDPRDFYPVSKAL